MNQAVEPDSELVAGVLAGDRRAFAGVYERYADRLYDFAFSMVRNREEAADCVADSFVVMAEKLDQLRDHSSLRPWLYSVVRNECLRTLRGRARVAHDDEWLAEMPDLGDGPEQQVEAAAVQHQARDLVWAAVEGLNDRDRALLDLHLRQGLEGAELAAAMDVTPANAYVMLSRARDQVERALGALLIARRGSEDCTTLADLLQDWDGRFSPLIRKRVARHIDGCDVCESRRKVMVSPLALLAAVPLVAAPAGLRERVLDDQRLVAYYADPAAPPVPPPGGDGHHGRRGGLLIGTTMLLIALGTWAVVTWWPASGDDLVGIDSSTSAASTADSATSDPGPTGPTSEPSLVAPKEPPVSDEPSPPGEPSPTATTDEPTVATPASLQVSTRVLDLGSRSSTGSVRLRNTGGTALEFTANPRAGWLDASPGSDSIEPGAATTLQISADRSALPEGASSGRVAVAWSGGTVLITVRLARDLAPRIGAIEVLEADECDATGRLVTVAATITDGSGVASTRVSWEGPSGATGQRTASRSADGWRATIGGFPVGGDVVVTFVATDPGGHQARRTRTISVDPCPG
ncbi:MULTISPECIES: sigma-70 family RNA polymerase sigma factor [Nocardioides]|uniref:Sigma-70 family RNA polymerase sigma factor n=1 Tax=Nocardioides vastitatis TaxID=2568655 RepID=A0ABW0ZKX8_9ACTN|nr:sigma-70 family RNA polymerase sigma factor [Nocardioides sp.]THI96059.1 sigma-70 family RNA polymerase sigma factor [Nocardioides sp.]